MSVWWKRFSANTVIRPQETIPGQMNTRILVVDDHEIVRKGLCRLIGTRSDWHVCGEAGNGREAIEKASALHPDLVLMDVSMPVMGGIEATREIRRLFPAIRVVIISLHDSPAIVTQAKEAGAQAFFTKSGAAHELEQVIAAVVNGQADVEQSSRLNSAGTVFPI